jgi:hypothetical protein
MNDDASREPPAPEAGGEAPAAPVDRAATRRKDPEIHEMVAALERTLHAYTERLEEELRREQERPDPHPPLVSGLQIMTALLRGFASFVDNDVWTWMITVADRSTSHVHRRTRTFF